MASETTFRVVIECPRTHQEVDTGLLMTREEFANRTIPGSTVECPHCGERHPYRLADAWLRLDRSVRESARNRHPYLRLNKMARRHQRRRPDPEP